MERIMTTKSLISAREGGVALIAALAAVPLLLAGGAAVDYGRAYFVHRSLQGVVDAAALAGVSSYRDTVADGLGLAERTAAAYFAQNARAMTGLEVGTPTIQAQASGSCSGGTAVASVTVSASTQVATSLMGLVMPVMEVSATATAEKPLVQFSLDLGDFNPGRMDADALALYWYKVPADNAVPTADELVKIADNLSWEPSQIYSQCVAASDRIGIALATVPGGRHPSHYVNPTNPYGGMIGRTYLYYSHLYPPTREAYSLIDNCALQIVEGRSSVPPATGRCFSPYDTSKPYTALASDGSFRCDALKGRNITFFWNDMGPGDDRVHDDYDYNDLILSFTCTTEDSASVMLTR